MRQLEAYLHREPEERADAEKPAQTARFGEPRARVVLLPVAEEGARGRGEREGMRRVGVAERGGRVGSGERQLVRRLGVAAGGAEHRELGERSRLDVRALEAARLVRSVAEHFAGASARRRGARGQRP